MASGVRRAADTGHEAGSQALCGLVRALLGATGSSDGAAGSWGLAAGGRARVLLCRAAGTSATAPCCLACGGHEAAQQLAPAGRCRLRRSARAACDAGQARSVCRALRRPAGRCHICTRPTAHCGYLIDYEHILHMLPLQQTQAQSIRTCKGGPPAAGCKRSACCSALPGLACGSAEYVVPTVILQHLVLSAEGSVEQSLRAHERHLREDTRPLHMHKPDDRGCGRRCRCGCACWHTRRVRSVQEASPSPLWQEQIVLCHGPP